MHGLITKCVMTVGAGMLVLNDLGVNVGAIPLTGTTLGHLGACYASAIVLEQGADCWRSFDRWLKNRAIQRAKQKCIQKHEEYPPLGRQARAPRRFAGGDDER